MSMGDLYKSNLRGDLGQSNDKCGFIPHLDEGPSFFVNFFFFFFRSAFICRESIIILSSRTKGKTTSLYNVPSVLLEFKEMGGLANELGDELINFLATQVCMVAQHTIATFHCIVLLGSSEQGPWIQTAGAHKYFHNSCAEVLFELFYHYIKHRVKYMGLSLLLRW